MDGSTVKLLRMADRADVDDLAARVTAAAYRGKKVLAVVAPKVLCRLLAKIIITAVMAA